MKRLRNLTMNAKVTLLASVFTIGLLLFGGVANWVVTTTKIGSTFFNDIIQTEHLMADVMPPPGFIVESFLNMHLMIDSIEDGPEKLAERIEHHKTLRDQHTACMERWSKLLPEGELKSRLLEDSNEPAKAFFSFIDNDIIPAIRANDLEKAETLIDDKLPELFNKHRTAMVEVLRLGKSFEEDKRASANAAVNTGFWMQIAIGLLVLLSTIGFTFWLRRGIAVQEATMLDFTEQIRAIGKSQAVIEFDTKGNVLTANANFLAATGYRLDEIVGRPHSQFWKPEYRNSSEYTNFWAALSRGEFKSGDFLRCCKDGKEIWIHANYNPILDAKGEVIKVVKFATDITSAKLRDADYQGQIAAINASQAVIEFTPEGKILAANENFCKALGYTLAEIQGQPHSMLVEDSFRQSPAYKTLWSKLRSGQYDVGEYKRIGKGGKEMWIQATYNPIKDPSGKVVKVVQFATDITAQKLRDADYQGQIQAISAAQSVIEFNMNGTIVTANENFCKTAGYSLDEIRGKHHSMFVDTAQRQSPAYSAFWQKLGSGHFDSGEYKRIGKGGREFYIQASYNPIFDLNGKPYKVVQYASDTTAIVNARERLKTKVDHILTVVSLAAQGDLTQHIDVSGSDPVGQLGDALNSFFSTLSNSIASISDNANALANASEELSAVSSQMSSNASETASQAQFVSAATEEVNANVSVVATGVEELNSAIREIAKSASDAASVSRQAVSVASQTNKTISKLSDSSEEIGKVVKVITSIAEQTNLLALNATIEAARAGEAGKGFAVVANEVKELAKETARATEDISHKIETIQADTNGAIIAIQEIGEVINRINDISNTIASAVEEQTATANEMGRNVTEAARGSAEISQNIISVADATQCTTQGANNSMQAASELSRMAGDLQQLVGQFKYHREVLNSNNRVFAPALQTTSFGSQQSV